MILMIQLVAKIVPHYATEGGHMNVVKYLITELGCDSTPNSFFALPLHIACLHGHFDIVKFLISDETYDSICCGLNINGITPLHYASQGGHLNIIQYLITELGCDPSIVDRNSRTVIASFPRSRGKYFRKLFRIRLRRIEWQALRG